MSWKKLEIKFPDLSLGDLTKIVDAIRETLEILVGMLELILELASTIADPLVAIIKTLIELLKAMIESFLSDLGGYIIFVPISKRLQTNFLGLGDITPSPAGDLGIFAAGPVPPTDPSLNEFLVNANRYRGGNAGFFKTVMDSLFDEGDLHRPQFFDSNDYIGGFTIVLGTANDPLGFLDDIWKLQALFDGPDTVPKVPRPKGLKARVVHGLSGTNYAGTSGTFSTLLTWDAPEVPIWTLADLGGVILFPARFAVIRMKNSTAAVGASSVVDLVGKRDLSVGDTFNNGDTEVIFEGEYDITQMSYLDALATADPTDSFYYTVAWKLKAYNADEEYVEGGGTDIDYWHISNVVRVTPYAVLPASTPPDWHRTSSIEDVFPQFAVLLRLMVAQIEKFAARLTGPFEALENYVEFLKSEILKYERIVNEILDAIAKLEFALLFPFQAGIYVRAFQGQGGNDFFISDLASSLSPSYPDSPPFHGGDEYVTGAILMAGGPQALVKPFLTSLSWAFGVPTDESEAMDQMLDELGAAVDDMEAQSFGTDMEPTDEESEEVEFDDALNTVSKKDTEVPVVSFGAGMEVEDANA